MAFPTFENPTSFSEKIRKDTTKVRYENGKAALRPKWTLSKKSFNLTWEAMSEIDKTTLLQYIDVQSGLSFSYTHPLSGVVYNVFIEEDETTFTAATKYGDDGKPLWNVTLILTEL